MMKFYAAAPLVCFAQDNVHTDASGTDLRFEDRSLGNKVCILTTDDNKKETGCPDWGYPQNCDACSKDKFARCFESSCNLSTSDNKDKFNLKGYDCDLRYDTVQYAKGNCEAFKKNFCTPPKAPNCESDDNCISSLGGCACRGAKPNDDTTSSCGTNGQNAYKCFREACKAGYEVVDNSNVCQPVKYDCRPDGECISCACRSDGNCNKDHEHWKCSLYKADKQCQDHQKQDPQRCEKCYPGRGENCGTAPDKGRCNWISKEDSTGDWKCHSPDEPTKAPTDAPTPAPTDALTKDDMDRKN